MYRAHYIHRTDATKRDYYRTIYADSINEAITIANRGARKGYVFKTLRKDYTL